MFQGKTNEALELLSKQGRGGILCADDLVELGNSCGKTVLDILRSKHPTTEPASPDALLEGSADPLVVHPVVFDQITAGTIRRAALSTKGATGPSGIDYYGWRRLCTCLKFASSDLCHTLAAVARQLCTTFVDPKGISPFLACRLIALDKRPGV